MKSLAACTFLLIATPLCACLWDRDTIALEAKRKLEVAETMVGWFDRFPPEYYQMRLDRVTHKLITQPEKLDLYDDAAVSCDRLGRHDEAVTWMSRKNLHMRQLPPAQTADHRYRMHANLGVFHTHLWLKSADRNTHGEKLQLAIDEVEAALKINPAAHFGRERAHLALLHWWQTGLQQEARRLPSSDPLASLQFDPMDFPETPGITHANLVKGLCGLIQMGSAQESLDVHFLIAVRLLHGSTVQTPEDMYLSLGHLACLRIAELALAGRQPVNPSAEFAKMVNPDTPFKSSTTSLTDSQKIDATAAGLAYVMSTLEGSPAQQPIPAWFHETRAAAQQRLAAKTAFMKERLAQGLHPDTRPDFWRGWQEPIMPVMPQQTTGVSHPAWSKNTALLREWFFLFSTLLIGALALLYVMRLRRRRL